MTRRACKLEALLADGRREPFRYGDIWQRQATADSDRLIIGASERQVDLLLELSRDTEGPFGILYVLLVSRCGNRPGRYQSPEPIDAGQLADFLADYRDYFENDGRHHVWIMSLSDSATLVYDNHDVVYAYGPLESYERTVTRLGLRNHQVRFPVPHTHCYNFEYDAEEERLFEQWRWLHFPLEEGDDR